MTKATRTNRTAHATLLLQADPGRAAEVASFVSGLPSVRGTALTSGPYDVIAEVDLTDGALARRTLALTRRAPGLLRVCVCQPGHVSPRLA